MNIRLDVWSYSFSYFSFLVKPTAFRRQSPDKRERERERERKLYLPQNNTNTVMQRATKNDNVAGCQKGLSPIKLATLQNRQIRQSKQ